MNKEHDEDDEFDELGPVPVETIDQLAVLISFYALKGRIGPTHEDDFEVESVLAQLSLLVQQQEPKI